MSGMSPDFTFIDLFAGIGGIRRGFESAGGECVFTSEWDRFAQVTYAANFPDEHPISGDITQIDATDIPDHDVLLAGFPCQPFSIAGVSKKNALGRPHGFMDKTQGTLFFDVARVIDEKRPAAFLLENVKNLTRHDKGRTFETIMGVLQDELGYHVEARVISAAPFVPQKRERILIAGFREPTTFSWDEFATPDVHPKMAKVLHPQDGTERPEDPFTIGPKGLVNDKYTLTPRLWEYLQAYAAKHRAAGNGFGFGLVGSEVLISQGPNKRPRRLTPREAARLMGYPDDFVIPVSDAQAYRQFGNSVVVPVMAEAARIMAPYIAQVKTSRRAA
jgi:DNA (cytosine-5)-methyltransferase 1